MRRATVAESKQHCGKQYCVQGHKDRLFRATCKGSTHTVCITIVHLYDERAICVTMERAIIILTIFGALLLCVTSVPAKKVRNDPKYNRSSVCL